MDAQLIASYRKIFDYTPVAFAILQLIPAEDGKNEDFRILYMNEACAKLSGQNLTDVEGKNFFGQFPEAAHSWLEVLRRATGGEKTVRRVYSNMLQRYMHIECYPIEPGVCGSLQLDVTEEIRRRQELEVLKESYEAAIASSGLRYWEYDLRHDRAIHSEQSQRELRIPKYMENYPQSWLDMNILLPEYWANYLDVHKKLKAGLKSAVFEEQIWSPNFETPRWEKIIYRTIFDEEGEPLKAIGTAVDVTEQKELEAAFRDFQQDQSMLAASRLDAYKLNVTRDTIVSIKTGTVVPGREKQRLSMTEFFHEFSQNIKDPVERAGYCRIYDRARMLAEYARGRKSSSFAGWYDAPGKARRYLRITLNMMQHPVTRDIIGMTCADDITEQKLNEITLECAVQSVFELVLRIDARTGKFRICQQTLPLRLSAAERDGSFEEATRLVFKDLIRDPEEYKKKLQELRLWNVIRSLNEAGTFTTYYDALVFGQQRRKRLQFSYIDKENMLICMACTDVTGSTGD